MSGENESIHKLGSGESPGEVGSIGFFGRLVALFTSPARLMDDVGRHPRWWAPLLFILVVVAFSSWMIMPIAAPESLGKMQDSVFGMALGPAILSVVLPWIVMMAIPLGIMLLFM